MLYKLVLIINMASTWNLDDLWYAKGDLENSLNIENRWTEVIRKQ
jgi:hypothetical protein